MKRFFFVGVIASLLVAPIFSTVWIGGSIEIPRIVHPTCNVIYEEKLYEEFNLTETEFLENLESHGYFLLTQLEQAEMPSLYLKKAGIIISIYKLLNSVEEQIYQSNELILPYCKTAMYGGSIQATK